MALQQRKRPPVWGINWTADELRKIVKRHFEVTEEQLLKLEHHELAALLDRADNERRPKCSACGQAKP